MRHLALTLAAAVALSACTAASAVREQTVDVGLGLYRSEACALGEAAELVRGQQRAEVYASTGVYVEADCAWRRGDTIDDFLARKAPEPAAHIVTPPALPPDRAAES